MKCRRFGLAWALMKARRALLKCSLFDLEKFSERLATATFGRRLKVFASLESTQQFLFERVPPAEEGDTCVADVQTAGKGRGSTVWESPRGCLTFSFQCRVPEASRLPTLQHLVSLAVARTGNENVCLRIKWPNDVYSGTIYDEAHRMKKVGGILLQSRSLSDHSFAVTVGVGLNVENDHPTTSLRALMSKDAADISREVVLARFFNVFEPMFREFLTHGFEQYLAEYRSLWLHTGQRLRLNNSEHSEVTVLDVSPITGFLLVSACHSCSLAARFSC